MCHRAQLFPASFISVPCPSFLRRLLSPVPRLGVYLCETESPYAAQAIVELVIIPPQPLEWWDCRRGATTPGIYVFIELWKLVLHSSAPIKYLTCGHFGLF